MSVIWNKKALGWGAWSPGQTHQLATQMYTSIQKMDTAPASSTSLFFPYYVTIFGVIEATSLTLGRHIQHAERWGAADDLLRDDGKAVDISRVGASPPLTRIPQQLRSGPKQIFIKKKTIVTRWLTPCSGWEAQMSVKLLFQVLSCMKIENLTNYYHFTATDWTATETRFDSENLEGLPVLFQGKTTYSNYLLASG